MDEIKEAIKELTILNQIENIKWYGKEKEAIKTALAALKTLEWIEYCAETNSRPFTEDEIMKKFDKFKGE